MVIFGLDVDAPSVYDPRRKCTIRTRITTSSSLIHCGNIFKFFAKIIKVQDTARALQKFLPAEITSIVTSYDVLYFYLGFGLPMNSIIALGGP